MAKRSSCNRHSVIHRAEYIYYLGHYRKGLTALATETFSSSEVHKISFCVRFEYQESISKLEVRKRKGLIKKGVEGRQGEIRGERQQLKCRLKNWHDSKEKTRFAFHICTHLERTNQLQL